LLLSGTVVLHRERGVATARLDEAAAAFQARGDALDELACFAQRSEIAFWESDQEVLLPMLARAFELEAEGAEAAVPLASTGRGGVAFISGDAEGALALLAPLVGQDVTDDLYALAEGLRADALLLLGRMTDALAATARGLARAHAGGRPMLEEARVIALAFTGEIDEALALARALGPRAEALGLPDHIALGHGVAAYAESRIGDPRLVDDHLSRAHVQSEAAGALAKSTFVLASASQAVDDGNEADAAAQLRVELTARPPGPSTRFIHNFSLALTYVLLPETRAYWDGLDLGPAWTISRDLARALVALREEKSLDRTARLSWPSPEILRAHVGPRWSAELAVAGVAAGRSEARVVLDQLGPQTRTHVRAQIESPIPLVARTARQLLADLPAPPGQRLAVNVLGPTELRRDGELVDDADWRRQRVRALLLYLVARPGATREEAAAALWPDLDDQAAPRNLRVTLSYLLRVLEPGREEREPSFLLRQDGDRLRLATGEWLSIDAHEFEQLLDEAIAAEASAAPSLALDAYRRALALYRGEFLADVPYEEWANRPRDRLRGRFVDAAARAGELLLAAGDSTEAVALAERAIDADPYAERAFRLLIAAHLAGNDRVGAVRALERCRSMLTELGARPAPDTELLERLVGA